MIFHHCVIADFFFFLVEVNFYLFIKYNTNVLMHTSYVGLFWVFWLNLLTVVKQTTTLATEQGALKQRILRRREDRNSCFLTEEAQMEAQVLLSAAITAARAVARWRGWKGCRPAACTNSDTDCNMHFSFQAVLEEGWDESTAPQPTNTRHADLLVTHTDFHTLVAGRHCRREVYLYEENEPQKIYPQHKKTEDCWCDSTRAS